MKKPSVIPSIILYIFALFYVAYTVITCINCAKTISDMISSGQLVVKGSEMQIVSFYMQSCAQYVFYVMLLFAFGVVLQRMPAYAAAKSVPMIDEDEETVSIIADEEEEAETQKEEAKPEAKAKEKEKEKEAEKPESKPKTANTNAKKK